MIFQHSLSCFMYFVSYSLEHRGREAHLCPEVIPVSHPVLHYWLWPLSCLVFLRVLSLVPSFSTFPSFWDSTGLICFKLNNQFYCLVDVYLSSRPNFFFSLHKWPHEIQSWLCVIFFNLTAIKGNLFWLGLNADSQKWNLSGFWLFP